MSKEKTAIMIMFTFTMIAFLMAFILEDVLATSATGIMTLYWLNIHNHILVMDKLEELN